METVYIRNIEQIDNQAFAIEWSDGKVSRYKLSFLQRHCPCAGCLDEMTGERKVDPETVPEELRAKKIVSVGNYAIRVFFSSGCHHGIFSYEYLRELEQHKGKVHER